MPRSTGMHDDEASSSSRTKRARVTETVEEALLGRTDKTKITRKQSKTGKHGHENQKSTKRSQRIKAKARKVKPQSNPVKEKSIIGQQKSTRPTIFHFNPQKLISARQGSNHSFQGILKLSHKLITTSAMVKAQRGVGFCAKTLSKEAQVSLKRIATLAIRVRSLSDPTAKNKGPTID
ncbi:hypothetical protein Tco_1427482 [Tanacetum coccineum]